MTREEKMQGVLAEFAKTGPWTLSQFLCTVNQYRMTAAEASLLVAHGVGPLCYCKDGMVRQR